MEDRLAIIEQKLDTIIDFLSRMDPENAPLSFPWTSKLLIEHASGQDQDGNNMVYGIDFAFAQTHESLPAALRSVAEYIDHRFVGRRITLTEYASTVDHEETRAEILAHVGRIGK